MRKVILAVCAAAIVFACSMLTTVTVGAVDRSCNHVMNSEIDGIWENDYSHQYWIKNEPSGPVYGSCYVHTVNYCKYAKCSLCGYVDYNHPTNLQFVSATHSACPLSGN
ncbi:MAG: hypothetical protein E7295_15150 [Lachnospiraceae bacterium]|jgi:hypothetical protein|nr:hypothetical protein [Lachnospiraceae bacterium]